MINVTPTFIPDLLVIEPTLFTDNRGYFFEPYNEDVYKEKIGLYHFVQDSEALSKQNVVRGLHFQLPPFAQVKLVRCIQGEILDVVVDLRKGSPTYAKHYKIILSSKNKKQLFIPKGFAHGYRVLSKEAVFFYKMDNIYRGKYDFGIYYNDPFLGIDWEIDLKKLIVSEKDKTLKKLNEINNPFKYKP